MSRKKIDEHEMYERLYASIESLEHSIRELRNQALAIAMHDMTEAEIEKLDQAMENDRSRERHYVLNLPDSLIAARIMAGRDE